MEIDTLHEYDKREDLRQWLQTHHAVATHCWVATYRSREPKGKSLPYHVMVEEALCFGWIDSTLKRLPDGRLAQRLSPRCKGSHWTELNRQRVRQLDKLGLMTPAGWAAYFAGLGIVPK